MGKQGKRTKKYERRHLHDDLKKRKTAKEVEEREEQKELRRAMRLAREEKAAKEAAEAVKKAGLAKAAGRASDDDELDELDLAAEPSKKMLKAKKRAKARKAEGEMKGMDFESFLVDMAESSDESDDGGASGGDEGSSDEGSDAGVEMEDGVLAEFGLDDGEFMASGSGSGSGSDDGEGGSSESVMASYKSELDALKDQDPAFFEFLQEHDAGLLEFGEPEVNPAMLAEAAKETHVEFGRKSKPLIELTPSMYAKWKVAVMKKGPTVSSIRGFVSAFKAAVALTLGRNDRGARARAKRERAKRRQRGDDPDSDSDSDDEDDSVEARLGKMRFRVESDDVFNMVVLFSIRNMHKLFNVYLRLAKGSRKKYVPGPRATPSKCAGWSHIERSVKSYLRALSVLLGTVKTDEVRRPLLVHLEELTPFLQSFRSLCSSVLRGVVGVWSRSDNADTIVHAFLTLRTMALDLPAFFVNKALQSAYLAFVRAVKVSSQYQMWRHALLANCLVELFGINVEASYEHGFVYIRQMAIIIRTAITKATHEARAGVLCWQFVQTLRLWVAVVSRYISAPAIAPLAYPLAQVLIGAASINNSARYIPHRLICAEELVKLSAASGTISPAPQLVLATLHSPALVSKTVASMAKPVYLPNAVRVTKDYAASRSYKLSVVDRSIWILFQYLDSIAGSIAFPELAHPILISLRRFRKTKAVRPDLRMRVSPLVAAAVAHAEWIKAARAAVSFAPADTAEVAAFAASLSLDSSPIRKAYLAAKAVVDDEHSRAHLVTPGDNSRAPAKRKRSPGADNGGDSDGDDSADSDGDDDDDGVDALFESDTDDDDDAPPRKRAKAHGNYGDLDEDNLPADQVEELDPEDW